MNFEQARYNMVEQQVRPWDVLDQRVLDLMQALPRDEFVPEAYRNLAYADIEIPLAGGQTMLAPKLEGRIVQALRLTSGDTVLEVGTGSGYLTALLAKLSAQVISIDINESFTQQANQKLAQHHIENVTLHTGNAAQGWEQSAPYDAIALTGSLLELPDSLKKQLKIGGRLFVVIGEDTIMEARLITRIAQQQWHTESLFDTCLPMLQHASITQRFVF